MFTRVDHGLIITFPRALSLGKINIHVSVQRVRFFTTIITVTVSLDRLVVFAPSFLCEWRNLRMIVLSGEFLRGFLRWFDDRTVYKSWKKKKKTLRNAYSKKCEYEHDFSTSGHINLRGLFNARAMLVEIQQWYYLIHVLNKGIYWCWSDE